MHEELNFVNFNRIPPLYAITDTQMVVYHDGKLEFVGGTPEIFGEKKI